MKFLVTGATGFIGSVLVRRLLNEGHQIVVLTRRLDAFKHLPTENLKVGVWDGRSVGLWTQHLLDVDAVVNLAGESIADGRWSIERKRLIKASRLESTRALVEALSKGLSRPRVLVNASATGYYGPSPEGEVTEDSPKGKGFLADVCADWENEAKKAESAGMRVVLLRFGIVVEKDGGALKKFIPPFKFYLGGPLGSGGQPFPWVHREDALGAILFAVQNETLSGPVNVVAPETLTMKQFCQALGRAMKRPCWTPVPGFALKAAFGEMSEIILKGQKAVPQKLLRAGYSFRYSNAEDALQKLFQK